MGRSFFDVNNPAYGPGVGSASKPHFLSLLLKNPMRLYSAILINKVSNRPCVIPCYKIIIVETDKVAVKLRN